MPQPEITVAVPSLNQGKFLHHALESIFSQGINVEVFVVDGGSTDDSIEVIKRWENKLAGWRSHADSGQSAAINEAIAAGTAPYVCWLNSDDFYYPNGLQTLLNTLKGCQNPAVYGNCWNVTQAGRKFLPYITLPFSRRLLANYCFIAQPSTLIRRSAWEEVGGLDESLHMAMDYDLWWKIYLKFGALEYSPKFVSANRTHSETKTQNHLDDHYRESAEVVIKYYGCVPKKWILLKPIMLIFRRMTKMAASMGHRNNTPPH